MRYLPFFFLLLTGCPSEGANIEIDDLDDVEGYISDLHLRINDLESQLPVYVVINNEGPMECVVQVDENYYSYISSHHVVDVPALYFTYDENNWNHVSNYDIVDRCEDMDYATTLAVIGGEVMILAGAPGYK